MAELGTTLANKLMEVAGSATIEKNCQIFGYKSQLEDLIKTVSAITNVLFDADSKQERLSHDELRGYIEDLKAALVKLFTDLVESKLLLDRRHVDAEKKFGGSVNIWILASTVRYRVKFNKFGLSVVDYNPICSIREETSSYVVAVENLQNRDQGNFHVSLTTTSGTNSFVHILKTIRSRTLGNRDFLSEVRVEGLETLDYLDCLQDRQRFTEQGDALTFESEVDRIYLSSSDVVALFDHGSKRTFQIRKQGLPDVAVWNPWEKKAKALADLGDDEYKKMLCVDGSAIEKPLTLKPGEEWNGQLEFTVLSSC